MTRLADYVAWGQGPGLPDAAPGQGYGTPPGICPRCHCCPESCEPCDPDTSLGLGRALLCAGGCGERGVHRGD